MCRIKTCNKPDVSNNLCNQHYFHYIWYKTNIVYLKIDNKPVYDEKGFPVIDLDNSVTGLVQFGQMLFPELILKEYGTPWFHYLIVFTVLESIGKPSGKYSMLDRMTAFECFRGSAKTTLLCFLFVVYAILSHCVPDDLFEEGSEEKQFLDRLRLVSEFIVIIMETQDQASQAVEFHQSSLLSNPSIIHYFGSFKSEKAGERINEKFNTTTIQTSVLPDGKRCKVWARGTGQKFRGIRFLNVRPRLIIGDDIESEDNTATPELRNKNKTWWRRRILNSCDLPNAAVINIGTMLGMDTILYRNLTAKTVKSVRIHILTEPDLATGKPVWEERFPVTEVKKLYEAACEDEDEPGFWQEYFGIFATEDDKVFPLEHFQFYKGEITIVKNVRHLRVDALYLPSSTNPTIFNEIVLDPPQYKQISIGLGNDIAVSQKKTADDSVVSLVVCSTESDFYVHEISYGKMEEVDVLSREDQNKMRPFQTMLDRRKVIKPGVVSENIRFSSEYKKIDLCVIETYGQQKVFVNLTYKYMQAAEMFFPILEFNEQSDKIQKVKTYIRPSFIRNKIFFNIKYKDTPVHLQFKHFPFYTKDDIVDSVTLIVGHLTPPMRAVLEEILEDNSYIPEIAKKLMLKGKEQKEKLLEDKILSNIYNSI